ncbi:MAG: ankyrin repeat domain-containing protein [Bacteroidales bacterium]|nr:ankyrin repeat domain-containing protein [Bacteroidales bacterium]
MESLTKYQESQQWDKIVNMLEDNPDNLKELDFGWVFSCWADKLVRKEFNQISIEEKLITTCIKFGYKLKNIPQAAAFADISQIKRLLKEGHEIDETDARQLTALMIAVLKDDFQLVKFLIDNGADNEADDCDGNKAIDYAIKETEIYALLKSSGVLSKEDVEMIMDNYYSTVDFTNDLRDTQIQFMQGAERGDITQMENALNRPKGFLILNGSYPVNGKTALHLAIENNRVESVKFLLAKGLDKNKADIHGLSPLQLARQLKQVEILKLLDNFTDKAI